MKWLRLYSDLLDDAKVQSLRPELFRFWINLLCLAGELDNGGTLPDAEEIAWELRVRRDRTARFLAELEASQFLVRTPQQRLRPNGWNLPETRTGEGGFHGYARPASFRLPPNEWSEIRERIFARDAYTCRYCGRSDLPLECDHVLAVTRGGGHEDSNLVTACRKCNRSKWAHRLEDWLP